MTSTKFHRNCPEPVSLELLREKYFPKIQSIYETSKSAVKKLEVHSQNNLIIGLDVFNNIWSMCTKDLLMIDFDYKLGFTQQDALDLVARYAEFMHSNEHDVLFHMYKTDRGLHAFLVNRTISNLDEEGLNMMIDMCNDPDYIAYTMVRGYCYRLSPKTNVKVEGTTLQDLIDVEFVSVPLEEQFSIGYGEPLVYATSILDMSMELTRWFVRQYRKHLKALTAKRYVPEIDRYQIAPPEWFLVRAKTKVKSLLWKYRLLKDAEEYVLNITPLPRDRQNHIFQAYSQADNVLSYDVYYGIWSICTNDVLMVDFDVKPGFTKLDALEVLREFTEAWKAKQVEYLFWIYETDRGVHAYLVNMQVRYDSWLSDKMLSSLGNDLEHIAFVKKAGHCVRISPKILINSKLVSRDRIADEFIAKPCAGDVCQIGYGSVDPYIEKNLKVQMNMINFVKRLYDTKYAEMTNYRYIPLINAKFYAPTEDMVEAVRRKFIRELEGQGLLLKDYTNYVTNATKRKRQVGAARYTDLVEEAAVNSCGRHSLEPNGKAGNMSLITYMNTYLKPIIESSCRQQNIITRDFFVLGYDKRQYMTYIVFYDLLMLDWDVIDGIPKTSPVTMLERYLTSQKLLSENMRDSKNDMCFKMYETDNGVHGFLVSHPAVFYTDSASSIMLDTCSDFRYAAFSRAYGYSIRLSPKVVARDMSMKSEADVSNQFIQKLGVGRKNKVVYVGNTDKLDPYLDELTDVIFDIQQFIVAREDIHRELVTEDKYYIEELRRFVFDAFDRMKHTGFITANNREWARGFRSCPYVLK